MSLDWTSAEIGRFEGCTNDKLDDEWERAARSIALERIGNAVACVAALTVAARSGWWGYGGADCQALRETLLDTHASAELRYRPPYFA